MLYGYFFISYFQAMNHYSHSLAINCDAQVMT